MTLEYKIVPNLQCTPTLMLVCMAGTKRASARKSTHRISQVCKSPCNDAVKSFTASNWVMFFLRSFSDLPKTICQAVSKISLLELGEMLG